MKGYLLDTSICVAIFRGNNKVAAKMNKVGKEKCFTTHIVVAELLFGAYRSNHVEENVNQTNEFIKNLTILPYEDCINDFVKERVRLWMIGCAAKAAGLTMVTHNLKHFAHIEGIEIEDWVE